MRRDQLRAAVSERLGHRRLVFSGLRGEDIEPLADLPQLHSSFSIIARYQRRDTIESLAHEDLTGVRADLETYDIDDHLAEDEAAAFRRAHLRSLTEDSALLPYRSSQFLSSIWFARRERCLHLGLFGGHESAFEHKPWVEWSLQEIGIPTVPWTYVADEDRVHASRLLADGPVVLRRSRTSGGEGFTIVNDPADLDNAWPDVPEAFVSVAPYLSETLPINVGATVWRDGVTVHRPSVQLVGIPSCVTRPFGYCGNDFALASEFDDTMIDRIEATTVAIGRWMRDKGYLGTFGVDFLLHQGNLLFTEINPRFQGSTQASCRLSIEADEGCLMLEHLAAFLGVEIPRLRPLRERVRDNARLAQFVVHSTAATARSFDPSRLALGLAGESDGVATELRTRPELVTEPGAVVARLVTRSTITTTGYDLAAPWRGLVDSWLDSEQSSGPSVRAARQPL